MPDEHPAAAVRAAGRSRRRTGVPALALLALLHATAALGATDGEFMQLLTRAEAAYGAVRDYTAVMRSVERVQEVLEPEKQILLKFQRPFKVYMRWMEGPGKGREGLYVAGAHDGKFIVAEPEGFAKFFTARLEPSDRRVLERSRHPVTDVGIGRLLEIVGENARRAVRARALQLTDRGVVELAGRPARQVDAVLPRDAAAGYYGYRITLCFDLERHLPVRVVVYDWQERLVEDYTYTQLVLNPGLTPRDFDTGNPQYGFSRWRLSWP
jgi:hypothetical protein